FFFQAEDGIRDFHVTGVQTCALPIWAHRCLRHIGISDLVAEAGSGGDGARDEGNGKSRARISGIFGIFDIDFMAWEGKPNRAAYEKVEAHVFARHPEKTDLIFADDRLENLVSARARG